MPASQAPIPDSGFCKKFLKSPFLTETSASNCSCRGRIDEPNSQLESLTGEPAGLTNEPAQVRRPAMASQAVEGIARKQRPTRKDAKRAYHVPAVPVVY